MTALADQDQGADYIEAAEGDAGGDVLPLLLGAAGAAGERLDRFLAARLPQYSRTRLQRWIALGAVYSDDRVLAAKTRLSGAERIVVEPQPLEAERSFRPEPVPLVLVDEDRNLIVLDKPVGLVVHPGAGNWSGTLMNGLLHRWPELAQLPRAGIVHRLDKDTSGLMVVAHNEATRGALIEQLATRAMSRRYLALVTGAPADSGSVATAIGRDPGNRLRMAVVAEARG
ncbi:MAG: RluA family pseudouridine synthase, partial [Burkholderiaceae bacterium]|nr:RluA family pseudouridine synthase [Burkholderiaceae bacterium]